MKSKLKDMIENFTLNESSEYLSISKFHSRITKESCKIV